MSSELKLIESKLKKNDPYSLDKLKMDLSNKYAKKFAQVLDDLEGAEFAKAYLGVLEYVKPKYSRLKAVPPKTEVKKVNMKIHKKVIEK